MVHGGGEGGGAYRSLGRGCSGARMRRSQSCLASTLLFLIPPLLFVKAGCCRTIYWDFLQLSPGASCSSFPGAFCSSFVISSCTWCFPCSLLLLHSFLISSCSPFLLLALPLPPAPLVLLSDLVLLPVPATGACLAPCSSCTPSRSRPAPSSCSWCFPCPLLLLNSFPGA